MLDAFYQVCQLASPVVEETYFDSFTHSGPQISESTEVRLYFFLIIYFFREDVLTFLSKLLSSHGDIVAHANRLVLCILFVG